MVENLQWEVAQGLLGSFDQFARVGFGERDTQVLSSRFPESLWWRVHDIVVVGITGKGIHVANEAGEIFVGNIRLETKLVLEGDGECQNQIHRSAVMRSVSDTRHGLDQLHVQLPQKIDFALLAVAFAGVDPDGAGQIAGCLNQLRPVLSSVCPSFVPTCQPSFGSIQSSSSAYLSYAVELRKDNARPTTKPSTVNKTLSIPTTEPNRVYVSVVITPQMV